jgi:hypothetical protein
MQIDIEERSPKESASGTVLLLSGQAMATWGLKLEPGYEIDAVDGAGLSWQLVNQLLQRGAPGDPRSLKKAARIDVVEEKEPISVSTTSAGGSYPAPWTAKGSVEPLGGGRIAFDIAFTCTAPGPPPKTLHLVYSGTWEQLRPLPVIPDATSLKGWVIHRIGPIHRSDSGGQILDYGATPTADQYLTVGDLRKSLAKAKGK